MSIWLELHCDQRVDANGHFIPGCSSNQGEHPAAMAKNLSSIRMTMLHIEREAVSLGWVRTRGRWVCPGCVRAVGGPSTRSAKTG